VSEWTRAGEARETMIDGSNLATRSAGWRMADISLCKVSFFLWKKPTCTITNTMRFFKKELKKV
jgi:hypothetical protein